MKDYEQNLSNSILTETGKNGKKYSPAGQCLSGYSPLESGQGSPGVSGGIGTSAGATKVYKLGSSGQEVKQILRRLWAEEGNSGIIIDGNFGSETEEAVIMFQRSKQIEDDDIVGGGTWRKLFPTLKRYGSGTKADNKDLQVLLNYQNYYVGTPAGVVGAKTWQFLFLDDPKQGGDFNTGTNIYKIGSSGDKVKQIQRRLTFEPNITDITVDGQFGTKTEKAVRVFQNTRGILVDGIVGNGTWRTLFPTLQEGRGNKDDVSALQRLMEYQCYKVDQDGIFGPKLKEAITFKVFAG